MPSSQTPHLSSDSIAEQFTEKMRAMTRSAKEREVEARAQSLGVGYVNLAAFPIPPETLTLIPRAQAEELHAVCFLHVGSELRIGALDPTDERIRELTHQLGERTHTRAALYAISEESLTRALTHYDAVPEIRTITTNVTITAADLARFRATFTDITALTGALADAQTSDLVSLLIAGAITAESSDIHIEAEAAAIALRYRIDGILQRIATIPKERWKPLISRVKLLAGLKLNITDVPQDGRVTIVMGDETVDIRVSTLPTAWGESVVMRLLLSSRAGISFDELGLRGSAFAELNRHASRPNGMIVTTGPTGSGKTTTLYAILRKLNTPDKKIITLEDPIEYKLAGINQSQIDPAREYTFAKGLRAILRQDPNIVMVGEIRDLETADVAIQAALTGHLMLSTIHTNSASGAIARFLSMGVQPFLLAPALTAIIGQRLVRKIHPDCKEPAPLTDEHRTRVQDIIATMPEQERKDALARLSPSTGGAFFHGKGCAACMNTGYKGRVGLYEIFSMSKIIEDAILAGKVSEYAMEELARQQGMVTMLQDGVLKALDGITSLDEVFRVAG